MSFVDFRELIEARRQLILLMLYVAGTIAVVIAARARYGFPANPGADAQRYLTQIYWTIWICIALCGTSCFPNNRRLQRGVKCVLTICLAVNALLQVRSYNSQISHMPSVIHRSGDASEIGHDAAKFLSEQVSNHQVVLSQRSYLLRIYLDINARKLAPTSECYFQPCLTREDLQRSGQSGLLWGLVIDNVQAAKDGTYGDLIRNLLRSPSDYPEFKRLNIDGPALIFKYVG